MENKEPPIIETEYKMVEEVRQEPPRTIGDFVPFIIFAVLAASYVITDNINWYHAGAFFMLGCAACITFAKELSASLQEDARRAYTWKGPLVRLYEKVTGKPIY